MPPTCRTGGHDGKTAYERMKGKTAKCLGLEFGEGVHWKTSPSGGAPGKLSSSWRHGVYLGTRGKSGEIIVSDAECVWKTRTVQRKSKDERWTQANVEMVKAYPWTVKGESDGDEERTVAVKMKDFEGETDRQVESKEVVPRNFYISAKNLEDHGFSSRCSGCLSILHGGARQAHAVACRKRFEIITSNSDRVKRAHNKITEYLAKQGR